MQYNLYGQRGGGWRQEARNPYSGAHVLSVKDLEVKRGGDVGRMALAIEKASAELGSRGVVKSLHFGWDQGREEFYPRIMLGMVAAAYEKSPISANSAYNNKLFRRVGANLANYLERVLQAGKPEDYIISFEQGVEGLWALDPPVVGPTLPIIGVLARDNAFLGVASVTKRSEHGTFVSPHLSWVAGLATKLSKVVGKTPETADAIYCMSSFASFAFRFVKVHLGRGEEDGSMLMLNGPYSIYRGYMSGSAVLANRLMSEAGDGKFVDRDLLSGIVRSADELLRAASSVHTPDFVVRGAASALINPDLRHAMWPRLEELVGRVSVDGLDELLDCIGVVAEQNVFDALSILDAASKRLVALSKGAKSVNTSVTTTAECLRKLVSQRLVSVARAAYGINEEHLKRQAGKKLQGIFSTLSKVDLSSKALRDELEDSTFSYILGCEANTDEDFVRCAMPVAQVLRRIRRGSSHPNLLDLKMAEYGCGWDSFKVLGQK